MIFAQITKVDEARREVWGRATQEVPDRSGEIFDYASSKPLFQKWSEDFEEASGGKSKGNIRSMHSKVAAGKVLAIDYNDDDKAIDIGAKIVDDNEWQKVVEGVHTGFSIGGRYIKRWKDSGDKTLTRFTAEPNEISLVDMPCVPTAKFDMVKADGTIEHRAFAKGREQIHAAQARAAMATLQALLDEERAEEGEPGQHAKELAAVIARLKAFADSEEIEVHDKSFTVASVGALTKEGSMPDETKPGEGQASPPEPTVEPVEKAGRKYSKSTASAIRGLRKAMNEFGGKTSECMKAFADLADEEDPNEPEPDDDPDDSSKAAEPVMQKYDDSALRKSHDELLAKVTALQIELDLLKSQPAPAKGSALELPKDAAVIQKSDETAQHMNKNLSNKPGEDDALALMKRALSTPSRIF